MTNYTERPEYRAHLESIKARPDDDLPRMVLADRLDEWGEHERAEFIRASVWSDGAPKRVGTEDVSYRQWQQWRTRETDLFAQHEREWFGGLRVTLSRHQFEETEPIALVRRGFVAEVRCRLADWIGGECACYTNHPLDHCPDCGGTGHVTCHGPAVVAAHPVQLVTLTDREPQDFSRPEIHVFGWHIGEGQPHYLPSEIHALIDAPEVRGSWKDFPTPEAALTALSAALIAWAKSQSLCETK